MVTSARKVAFSVPSRKATPQESGHPKTGKQVATREDRPGEHPPASWKSILLIEDNEKDSDRCRDVLHELGYDGVQLITTVQQAANYLDDVLHDLIQPPDAIVIDLGLGYDSGFDILRKCHGDPKLSGVPILVWSRCAQQHTRVLSQLLGAKDFLVKTPEKQEFRAALERLLSVA
jgi:DNA-binding response OmpR family regulator